MKGRIPRSFIDDLLARADIVELIDSYVPLKKAGRNYQACCPFHNEKTPSFSVAPDKQFYHCFGCGAHGNAISFLMEYERLEFPEAIEELANFYKLEVPREEGNRPSRPAPNKAQLQDDYSLMENVTRFFSHQLKHHSKGSEAIEYLKNRGLTGEVVKAFGIGYAPPEWDAVLSQFGKSTGAKQQLLALKLVNQNDNGRQYDFFRERIMFPIRDKRGRVIGFGGRIMAGDGPKYLNSPETRIFHKGSELYGLYQAKQNHRKLEKVIIVEGYMDVVSLAQFGIDYAVASLGTATTPEHVQQLFRNTKEIVCCYDGDRAGREAAWRALENALPHLKDGCQIKFLFLPDGEDPDTLVRQIGKDEFESRLTQAKPLSQFFFDNLVEQYRAGSLEEKAALKAAALPLLEKIPGEQTQKMLLQQLARFTGEQDQVRSQQDIAAANNSQKTKFVEYKTPATVKQSPIRMMIRLLLAQPSIASECLEITDTAIAQLSEPGSDLLVDLWRECVNTPDAHGSQIVERFREHPNFRHLSKLLVEEMPEKDRVKEYRACFATLINSHIKSRMDTLLAKSQVATLTLEEKQELVALSRAGAK